MDAPDRTRHNTCTTSPSLNPNAPPFAPTPGKNDPYAQPYSLKARPSQPPFRNTTQNTQVQILYFNARSLTNKRQELLDTLRSLSSTPQIIAITETWLTDNIPDMAWSVFQITSRFFARTARSKRGDVAEESSSLREMMLSVRVVMIYKRCQKVYGSKPGCSFPHLSSSVAFIVRHLQPQPTLTSSQLA